MIYILRHGQTELNRRFVLQGRSDYPLNEVGKDEAKEAGKMLSDIRFDFVYSSPLKRAVETAKIAVPYLEPILDDRLLEMDYGPYEEMDLRKPAPEVMEFFKDFVNNPAPKGMEQLSDVVKRSGEFTEECLRKEGNILISTHAISMKGILEYLTPESKGAYWSKNIGNCEIYAFEFVNGTFTVPKKFEV